MANTHGTHHHVRRSSGEAWAKVLFDFFVFGKNVFGRNKTFGCEQGKHLLIN